MDGLNLGPLVNGIGVVGLCVVIVFVLWRGFLSDKIVSGKRLAKAEERADRWEQLAFNLATAAQTVVPAVETVQKIVEAMPDPARDVDAGAS